MLASFEYDVSGEVHLYSSRAIAKSLAAKDPRGRWRIVWELAFLAAVYMFVALGNPGCADAVLVALVLTVAGGCILQGRTAKSWRRLTYEPSLSHIAVSFDDDGVLSRQDGIERSYAWKTLRRLHQGPEALLLEFSDWHAIPLPQELWSAPNERANFIEEVRGSAKNLLSDLPPVEPFTSQKLVILLAAGAFGIQSMVATTAWMTRLRLRDCTCGFRHALLDSSSTIVPFVVYAFAVAATWFALRAVARRWPRIAMALAVLLIAAFAASQAIAPAVQIYGFFNPRAP